MPDAKIQAVIDQLERLLAENDKQHQQSVAASQAAIGQAAWNHHIEMINLYAHYGDGLRDAITVIRQAFEMEDSNE